MVEGLQKHLKQDETFIETACTWWKSFYVARHIIFSSYMWEVVQCKCAKNAKSKMLYSHKPVH